MITKIKIKEIVYSILLTICVFAIQATLTVLTNDFLYGYINSNFGLRRDMFWGFTIRFIFIYYCIYSYIFIFILSFVKNYLALVLSSIIGFLDFCLIFIYFIDEQTFKTTIVLISIFTGFSSIALLLSLILKIKRSLSARSSTSY